MAFSGLHVVCAYAGASFMRDREQTVLGKVQWSESPATGVTTTNHAPPPLDETTGQPVFRIRTSSDAWVSVGPEPNATSGTRFLVPANIDFDIYVEAGDKLQWIST
ncbi:hypothetical protein CFBP7129_00840 [Agrobacterium tumefaciens]|uniref:Uncharacterized protein n=2 Tax=Agrobacterium tumefaciens TaxID=358 RepID=A0A4D7YUY7_AGRTU|nr:hypothetical protein CFBP7129_00840 [Agrobacterium tumefaciens]